MKIDKALNPAGLAPETTRQKHHNRCLLTRPLAIAKITPRLVRPKPPGTREKQFTIGCQPEREGNVKKNRMLICGLAMMIATSLWASTTDTASFSPIFVRDAAGKLRTLTWTYLVSGGQPMPISSDALDATFRFSDLEITIDPIAQTREAQFTAAFSGNVISAGASYKVTGNVNAKVVERLEPLTDSVLVKDQTLDMNLQMTVPGAGVITVASDLLTQFTPSATWFLDRSDLDQAAIGDTWEDDAVGGTTGSVTVKVAGQSSTAPVDCPGTDSDRWTITDKLDHLAVGSITYSNVVVVQRDTMMPTGDLNGTVEPAVITYWVVQGVGMVKGVGQYQIMGTPLTIEIKNKPPQTQTITFPPLPTTQRPGSPPLDPLAKASSQLPVTYVSANEAVAVVNAQGMIEVVGIGTSTITAYQNGSYDFKPAPPASKLLIIKPMIVATCEPVSAGKVGGAGLYAPGQKATLTARPATGYTFAHWEDASLQTSPRVLIVPTNHDVTVTATFIKTSDIQPPTIETVSSQFAKVAVPFNLRLQISSATLPKVVVSGLPPGLRYDSSSQMIAGIPLAATPSNKPPAQVKVLVSNVANKRTPVATTFSITVAPR